MIAYYNMEAGQNQLNAGGGYQLILSSSQRVLTRPQSSLPSTPQPYKDTGSCRSTFANSLKKMGLSHIVVKTRRGRVFLVNTLLVRGAKNG